MPTYENTAVAALVDLINNTGTGPEAAIINTVSAAARQAGLIPNTAPTHPRDTPPKNDVRALLQVASTQLDAEQQARQAGG